MEKRLEIQELFADEHILVVRAIEIPWFADFVNYLFSGLKPLEATTQQLKKFLKDVKEYYWDEPYLYKLGPDQIEEEVPFILEACHLAPDGGCCYSFGHF
ncbi:MAG: hypothetical protein Q8754_02880 [Sweet potato little leaf phytoplasma]|nr:hypothetical protein [Sweet potato little leaf phytoplasma]